MIKLVLNFKIKNIQVEQLKMKLFLIKIWQKNYKKKKEKEFIIQKVIDRKGEKFYVKCKR